MATPKTGHTPQVEGVASFQGHIFHTSRWDYSIDLRGKTVGISDIIVAPWRRTSAAAAAPQGTVRVKKGSS